MEKIDVKRSFIPGDEWLYLKIYTGFKTADILLSDVILPFVSEMISDGVLKKWFFIRYNDPEFHLRVRFCVDDRDNLGRLIVGVNRILSNYMNDMFVWKVQYDTYNRELERYGECTMELSEEIFYHDSVMVASIVKDSVNIDDNKRWLLALRMADALLNDFGYDPDGKCKLADRLQQGYALEFGIKSGYKRQFGDIYRGRKAEIDKIMSLKFDPDDKGSLILLPILEKSKNSKGAVDKILKINGDDGLQVKLDDLMASYIHMMFNRLFRSRQRMHELVLYDYLFRYYTSEIKRKDR